MCSVVRNFPPTIETLTPEKGPSNFFLDLISQFTYLSEHATYRTGLTSQRGLMGTFRGA